MTKALRIGLIREGKNPPDTRVAFTPTQCAEMLVQYPGLSIVVEPSPNRCFTDDDYRAEGIEISSDLSDCDILFGIKEVPVEKLIEGKTYCFFSHTKKKQPYNQKLMKALIQKRIRLIDYECLTHQDGQRIIGFGFYAGVVGAHNGILTYGKKNGLFHLPAAHNCKSYQEMIDSYGDIKLPNVKIVVTGSGRVASGILDVMSKLDVECVEPEDFLSQDFDYPVYVHLKGNDLFSRIDGMEFHRDDLHEHPELFHCNFPQYFTQTDILMNGIYWDEKLPRLFEKPDVHRPDFKLNVIADITCDIDGSVPINVGASTIADPVYGIDRNTLQRVAPFQHTKEVIDVMAVDNLPNELPADASHMFGTHLEKYVIAELITNDTSDIIERATVCQNGKLTPHYEYLSDYAY